MKLSIQGAVLHERPLYFLIFFNIPDLPAPPVDQGSPLTIPAASRNAVLSLKSSMTACRSDDINFHQEPSHLDPFNTTFHANRAGPKCAYHLPLSPATLLLRAYTTKIRHLFPSFYSFTGCNNPVAWILSPFLFISREICRAILPANGYAHHR